MRKVYIYLKKKLYLILRKLRILYDVSYTPEPGFEPESEAPQASRISKLPHSGLDANTTIPAMVEHSDANYFFVSNFIIYLLNSYD